MSVDIGSGEEEEGWAVSQPSILAEITSYVRFDADDAARLRALGEVIECHFDAIVDDFYEAIERSPEARAVFESPAQIRRQKVSLRRWLDGVVGGIYDAAYYEQRARIGRAHVRIGLDQRYMLAAMNVVRTSIHRSFDTERRTIDWSDREYIETHLSIDRICDIELAIMLETYREDYVRRIRSSERLATLGQFAASIGHELRNPLAVIDTSLHLIRRRVEEDPRVARHIERIGEQTALCSTIIADLLDLARDRDLERHPTFIRKLVEAAASETPRGEGVSVVIDIQPELEANVDASQLRQLLMNLLANAVDAVGAEGQVSVAAAARGARLELSVRDTGAGLSEEVKAHLFEPLFTTKQHGIGLGLALCHRIVSKHGGEIRAENHEDGGALISIILPESVGSAA